MLGLRNERAGDRWEVREEAARLIPHDEGGNREVLGISTSVPLGTGSCRLRTDFLRMLGGLSGWIRFIPATGVCRIFRCAMLENGPKGIKPPVRFRRDTRWLKVSCVPLRVRGFFNTELIGKRIRERQTFGRVEGVELRCPRVGAVVVLPCSSGGLARFFPSCTSKAPSAGIGPAVSRRH